jgi:dTDP-4-dehydrorhamnose 3,5-epimerase
VKFEPLAIAGAYRIRIEPSDDERGFFARFYCRREFEAQGIPFSIEQGSLSYNREAGTLRGMHYQCAPCPEIKWVRCVRGRAWDCIIDLRDGSPTFGQWVADELSAENRAGFLVPGNCAHGFLTLEPDTELMYLMSAPYEPDLARAVRWDDPFFAIAWPASPTVISERDRRIPDFKPA